MIKITSFYRFQNFLKVTQEFDEDKVVVKMKSLTFESEDEFEYKDVGEISDGFYASNNNFGFWLTISTVWPLILFFYWFHESPSWLRIVQILFVSGILLYAISFIKSRHIFISDKNRNTLTRIHQTYKNRELVLRAIEMIRSKSEKAEEITTANPFPLDLPAFEHQYTIFSNLKKTIDKFYQTELIGHEKSIYGKGAYKIKYDLLNGKVYRGKVSVDIWEFTFSWCVLAFAILAGIHLGFPVPIGEYTLYISYVLIGILIIPWLLRFIKREVFGFYNKNGQIEYWAYINRRDKEKVEKIIEFVKSRIPAETTAEEQ
jgi:hypothetical protein